MNRIKCLLENTKCVVIGMIHARALPGTPKFNGSIQAIIDKSCAEAELYVKHKVDAVMIENMHDVPYQLSENFTPETTAVMARVCSEVKRCIPTKTPCGVQVLACGNKESLAVATACDLDFVRVEGFVFGHIGDEGPTWSCAGPVLRYRKQIGADNVMVWTDIKKKHSSHAITADLSLLETARAAEFFLSDGVILTGGSTGDPADPTALLELTRNCTGPVIVGSGVTVQNLREYFPADAIIVGSYFKHDGHWANELDESRIGEFMEKMHVLRGETKA